MLRFLVASIGLFSVSNATCSIDVGENDNPLLQCKVASYWNTLNASFAGGCNSPNWDFAEREAITSRQKNFKKQDYWRTVMWFLILLFLKQE